MQNYWYNLQSANFWTDPSSKLSNVMCARIEFANIRTAGSDSGLEDVDLVVAVHALVRVGDVQEVVLLMVLLVEGAHGGGGGGDDVVDKEEQGVLGP